MIAFGIALTDVDQYEECAEPGIAFCREPDTRTLVYDSAGSIFRNYNLILDDAAKIEGLEAIVLIHQDAEITDPDFIPKVRAALEGPDVAIVGCAGAVGVRNIAWWEGSVTWASFTHRYKEMGGGEIPAVSWLEDDTAPYARLGEVDSVDGFVMAFSPWAIQNLRFDESIGTKLHGYDFDICMQARQAGKKVVTADLKVVHHHTLSLVSDAESWVEAQIKLAEKWEDVIPPAYGAELTWKERARRAEAETSVARMIGAASDLLYEARNKELQREVEELRSSTSWKVTAPLRWLTNLFRRRG
ncbi:MAG: hypothetical protein KDB62_09945 [Solirubrobacterales bacterium]|nr:hypothetical protein [Solirubrobacterales bacterium]